MAKTSAYLCKNKEIVFRFQDNDYNPNSDAGMRRETPDGVDLDEVWSRDIKPDYSGSTQNQNSSRSLATKLRRIADKQGMDMFLNFRDHQPLSSKNVQKRLEVELGGDFLKKMLTELALDVNGIVRLEVIINKPSSTLAKMMEIVVKEDERPLNQFTTGEMELSVTNRWSEDYVSYIGTMRLPKHWDLSFMEVYEYNALLTIKVIVEKDSIETGFPGLSEQLGLYEGDMEIVASNDVVIKCSKSVLMAQSDELKRMVEAKTSEGQTNRIVLDDLSEDGVKALLDFIRSGNLNRARGNMPTTAELLKFGHTYSIRPLENAAKRILMSKSIFWYKVEDIAAILNLLSYVNNVDNHYDLKLLIVKLFNLKKKEILLSSSVQKIFQENSDAKKQFENGLKMYKRVLHSDDEAKDSDDDN